TFLKMWASHLRAQGFPVVYFDAYANDYVPDAFAALVGEILELAESKLPKTGKAVKQLKERGVALGGLLLRGGLKLGARIAIRVGTAGLAKASDLAEVAEEIASEGERVSNQFIEDLLGSRRQQADTVELFRE